jgi:hypothetical protein
MDPIMSSMNPVHIITTYSIKIHFNGIVPSTARSPKGVSLFRFSDYNFVRATAGQPVTVAE